MRRSGFTVIELIFVIVILGILASVAIPRLSGVQDDALVSSEKSAIGAARGAIASIRGKALMRGGNDFNVTVMANDGTEAKFLITNTVSTPAADTCYVSSQRYPLSLSASNVANGVATPVLESNSSVASHVPMILVLEADGRDSFATAALTGTDANNTKITGPASSTIATSSDAEITTANYWLYNSATGAITLQ